MKNFLIVLLLMPTLAHAQQAQHDSVAIVLLDRMSAVIGDLGSVRFHLETSEDKLQGPVGLVKHFGSHEVHMLGPDKMLIQSEDHNGHKGYWYNGQQLAYYDYDENNYIVVKAPPTIIAAIDSVSSVYGIDFPAADFFYPTFVDDLLDFFPDVQFMGKVKINGVPAYHILATNDQLTLQIWLADDGITMPLKYVMTYRSLKDCPQYEATFSQWQLNPDLPEAIFQFIPPPGARQVAVAPIAN